MTGVSKRILIGGVGAVGLLAGVATLVGANLTATPTATAAPTGLTAFDDCEQLRATYVGAALPHVTAWGWDTGDVVLATEIPAVRDTAATAGYTDAVGNGATGTNLQEADVDEPDMAKTDGELVALVRHGDLIIVDASGDEPREIGRLDIPNRHGVRELLLVGDRVVLLGSSGGDASYGLGRIIPVDGPYPVSRPARTTITTVGLADPTAPSIVRTETVDGELVSARAWGSVVRVVTTWTPDFDFVHPDRRLTATEAAAKNRQIVRQAAAEEWLPGHRVDDAPGEPLLDCADVRHPRDPAGLGTISVLTMDADTPGAGVAIGVAADGDLTYASDDRLYVATANDGWSDWTWRPDGEPARTDIHAFDVDGDDTTYLGSGDVPGRVPDRWAFSEHEGALRVASTVGPQWRPRETRVTVLDDRGGALRPIGSVGGMGETEQIEAVRWFGEFAVVVTFRQVDPLYTLDLSDPTRPTVAGELKIPGFSAYLHPIGAGMLLGVGQDASMQGRLRGGQVSTFDLGDLADPRRLDTLDLGRNDSAVEWDSRAFTYLPSQQLAFMPSWSWRDGSTVQLARVFVDGDLSSLNSIPIPGGADRARVLPLHDGRVAIVAAGDLVDVVNPLAR